MLVTLDDCKLAWCFLYHLKRQVQTLGPAVNVLRGRSRIENGLACQRDALSFFEVIRAMGALDSDPSKRRTSRLDH